MNTKFFHITFVVLLVLSILSGLFAGNVSQAHAQSSRVWSDPINLSHSGGASNPVFVADGMGNMHAIWVDELDGYRYAQSTDGVSWTAPQNVKYPFDTEGALPTLLAGPTKGLIYVFFQTKDKSLRFAQANSEILDEPASWAFQGSISVDVLAYHVTLDPQGWLHIAYIRNKDNNVLGPSGVYYSRSTDEGRSWSTEKFLYGSQYFRNTKPEAAHIRVAVADEPGNERVHVVWDNTFLKRIFMSTSTDSGQNWGEATQLKGPEDTGGYDMPFNAEVSINGQSSLLLWEVGEPGANQCNLYGQWSEDGGDTWGKIDIVLGARSVCPVSIDFLIQENGVLVALFSYLQGSPSLIAWNGAEWSESQPQDELSFLSNPATNETLLLGCQYHAVRDDRLFIIGCDQGSGGDIWVVSRTIVPITDWIFSTSLWDLPTLMTSATQGIPSLAYAAAGDYLHMLWSQTPLTKDTELEESIYYSRWNGSQWLPALDVIYGLKGVAGDLALTSNRKDRLFMTWSDRSNGDLLFSWANSSKANSSAEWLSPIDLPAPSEWTSSPDILVDISGTIVIVYAVPINEKRGIYMIQSGDNGVTWSTPLVVFDAEAAGWVMVDHPEVALDRDGRLHVLFTSYAGLIDQPAGLYYLQSSDGGFTWGVPDVVSEGSVVWSDITTYGDGTVHRLWQQDDGTVVANLHQESSDGGATWNKATDITGVNDEAAPVTLVSNNAGELHFIQLVREITPAYLKKYNLDVQDWKWNGSQWENQPSQKISIVGEQAQFSIAAGISLQGYMSVSLLAKYYDQKGELKNEIYTIGRTLSDFDANAPVNSAVIAGPGSAATSLTPVDVQPGASPQPTPVPDLSGNEPSVLSKNLVGIILVLVVIVLTIFVFLRKVRRTEQG